MNDTQKRIKNPRSLERLGKQLRFHREQAGIAQSKVRGMRQATISKVENGGDVTLDTFISYTSSLGLDPVKSIDLLDEFSDLMDEE